jgi:hypothetical protein
VTGVQTCALPISALWVDRSDQPHLSSLLVPRGLYQPGQELNVEQGQPASVLVVDRLVESTTTFDRFSFRIRPD